MVNVSHFHRKPDVGAYSLERIFKDVREEFPADINVAVKVSAFLSRGFLKRLYNIFEASFRQSEVNHITGDVHFLIYALAGRRTVLTILDCVGIVNYSGLKRWVFIILWYRLPVRKAAVVTVISQTTKQELLKYVTCSEEKIKVINCPLSNCFKPYPQKFNNIRPNILQLGTAFNKNVERVAEALVGINCKWVIVGRLSIEQVELIEGFGIDFENVFGLSEVDLLEKFINSDFLVFASTYEGFGMPIIEANAVGRAVVTSNVCSINTINNKH